MDVKHKTNKFQITMGQTLTDCFDPHMEEKDAIRKLKQFLLENADSNTIYDKLIENVRTPEGCNLLYMACVYGWETFALLLLDNCGNIQFINFIVPDCGVGCNPLMIAISNGMERTALKIIASDSRVCSYVSKTGATPLMYACKYKMPNVALELLKTGRANTNYNDYRALIIARQTNMPKSVMTVLEYYQKYGAVDWNQIGFVIAEAKDEAEIIKRDKKD